VCVWIGFIWLRIGSSVNVLWGRYGTSGSIKGGDFLNKRITITISRITLLHGIGYKAMFCKAIHVLLHHIQGCVVANKVKIGYSCMSLNLGYIILKNV
jgi:hypothetical protein